MCPRTFKNTNTYYKHVRNEHGNKYAGDASVASKYLLSANTLTTKSVNGDPNGSGNSNSDIVQSDLVSHRPDQCNLSESDNISDLECDGVVTDVTKVASGHLIQLKCRAGVTQSIFPSIVEMNEAVVDNVLNSVSWKVAERLQANGIGPEEPLATDIQDIIESHRNPLHSFHTIAKIQ